MQFSEYHKIATDEANREGLSIKQLDRLAQSDSFGGVAAFVLMLNESWIRGKMPMTMAATFALLPEAEWRKVSYRLFDWALTDPNYGAITFTDENTPQRKVIEEVVSLVARTIEADEPADNEWTAMGKAIEEAAKAAPRPAGSELDAAPLEDSLAHALEATSAAAWGPGWGPGWNYGLKHQLNAAREAVHASARAFHSIAHLDTWELKNIIEASSKSRAAWETALEAAETAWCRIINDAVDTSQSTR